MMSQTAFFLALMFTQPGELPAFAGTESIEVSGPQDMVAARKQTWQKVLERQEFRFSEASAGIFFSLSQYRSDCHVHLIYDPAKRTRLTFKFIRDNKEILAIEGHEESSFRAANNVLFFAHFWPRTDGCTVTSHALTTGSKLWETKLNAVGGVQHSAYRNEISMGLSSLQDVDKKGEGIVSIRGRESYGDYVEILDQKTGTILAHKIYRKGYVLSPEAKQRAKKKR